MKFLFLSLLFSLPIYASEVIDRIVVIVNDEIITASDIQEYRNQLKNNGLVDMALLSSRNPESLIKNNDSLIQHLIDEKILDSEVKKQKLSATIEQVEQEIRTVTKNANQGQGLSREQLKEALRKQGVLFSDYQAFIKKNIERRALIEKEIKSQIKISDDDITTYYISTYGSNKTQIFEYSLAHIMTLNNTKNREIARTKAQVAFEKLGATSFEEVAEQYSEDPNFTSGGLMGTVRAGEMRPEISKAVKSLSVGSHSKVIETPYGFEIVKLLKKSLIENPDITAKKMEIRNILSLEAMNSQLQLWLERKRAQAFIRRNNG